MRLGDITAGLDTNGNPILTTDGVSQIDPASVCMPPNFAGPLAPGQVYCASPSPSLPSVPTTCPAGATCSIIPGIPNTNIYLGVAAAVAFLFLAMGGARR